MRLRARWSPAILSALVFPCWLSGCDRAIVEREPGAIVPWSRYEAEDARSNIPAATASRDYLTPESEASGRSFVRLKKPGDVVEFDITHTANALVLRYSIPDSEDGKGLDATLSMYLNGKFQEKLKLTSRFAWIYGDFPWTNNPAAGRGHYFFDEHQILMPRVGPGDVIRLQVDADDKANDYLIDFIELEDVPPPRLRPANSLSIEEFGARPDDTIDDAVAFEQCLNAAKDQGKIAWIPAGTFILNGSVKGLGGVDVRGAGMWYSRLTGSAPMFYGYGERFSISDLAIFGEVNHRNDASPDNAFFGNLGDGSTISRVWIEHMKCGIWSNHGTKNLRIADCRIRNTMADGVNLCDGTSDSIVQNCHLRNNGDDALASWSPTATWSSKQLCERNRFFHNTIELPWHANGLAFYGGKDHEASGNLVVDTVFSGGGLLISSGHSARPFEGTLRVENNRFIRTGGDCYIDGSNGGLWIHAHESDIGASIVIRNTEILDSAHDGITVHGPHAIRDLTIENILIHGTDGSGVHRFSKNGKITMQIKQ